MFTKPFFNSKISWIKFKISLISSVSSFLLRAVDLVLQIKVSYIKEVIKIFWKKYFFIFCSQMYQTHSILRFKGLLEGYTYLEGSLSNRHCRKHHTKKKISKNAEEKILWSLSRVLFFIVPLVYSWFLNREILSQHGLMECKCCTISFIYSLLIGHEYGWHLLL